MISESIVRLVGRLVSIPSCHGYTEPFELNSYIFSHFFLVALESGAVGETFV
jgi:hypothetical protein